MSIYSYRCNLRIYFGQVFNLRLLKNFDWSFRRHLFGEFLMASMLALFQNATNLFRMSLISLEPIFLDFNAYLTLKTALLKEFDDSSFIEQTIMLELSCSTSRLFLKFCQKHLGFNNYCALIAEKVIGSMRRRCFLGEYFELNDFQPLLLNCLFNYFATIQSSGSHCKKFELFNY